MNAMQMRLIVTLDDKLVAKASKLTSITDHSALVHAALEALIQDQTERQLGEPTTSEAMPQRTPHCEKAIMGACRPPGWNAGTHRSMCCRWTLQNLLMLKHENGVFFDLEISTLYVLVM